MRIICCKLNQHLHLRITYSLTLTYTKCPMLAVNERILCYVINPMNLEQRYIAIIYLALLLRPVNVERTYEANDPAEPSIEWKENCLSLPIESFKQTLNLGDRSGYVKLYPARKVITQKHSSLCSPERNPKCS